MRVAPKWFIGYAQKHVELFVRNDELTGQKRNDIIFLAIKGCSVRSLNALV